ncbi:hypothetical protein [Pseudomonas aeruginosa]|uniref:hypothetical protein n=1 Tax=Pseudomonas aeruginosa TaxID=287 RepID=UPI00238198AC|nr:hypothetical protein [Pseudomonas aeruginosa]
MRRTNAAEKKRRQELRTIALLVIVLLSMAGGIGWYFLQRPTAIDKLTLCPASGPLGHYVVLVDNTDPYNFIQRQAFAQGLKSLARKGVPVRVRLRAPFKIKHLQISTLLPLFPQFQFFSAITLLATLFFLAAP